MNLGPDPLICGGGGWGSPWLHRPVSPRNALCWPSENGIVSVLVLRPPSMRLSTLFRMQACLLPSRLITPVDGARSSHVGLHLRLV